MKIVILLCNFLLGSLFVAAQTNSNDSIPQKEHVQLLNNLLTNQRQLTTGKGNKPTGIGQRLTAQTRLVTTNSGIIRNTDSAIFKYSGKRGSEYFASAYGDSYSWTFQRDFLNCLYSDYVYISPEVLADSIMLFYLEQPRDTSVAFYNSQDNLDSFFRYGQNIIPGSDILKTTQKFNSNGLMTQSRDEKSVSNPINFTNSKLREFWYDNTNTKLLIDTSRIWSGSTWGIDFITKYHHNTQNNLDSIVTYILVNGGSWDLYKLVAIKYDNEDRITNLLTMQRSPSGPDFASYIDTLGYTGNFPDYTFFGQTYVSYNNDTSKSRTLIFLGNNNLPDSTVQLGYDASNDSYSYQNSRKLYYNSFNNPDSIRLNFVSSQEQRYRFYYETYDNTPEPIGVKEIDESSAFSVYPNPFNKQINIDWKMAKTAVNISVINILGQSVFNTKKAFINGINSIDLPALSKGNYILTIQNEKGEIFTNRLTKK